MNHENQPRYNVRFDLLTVDQLDELIALVAREAGGNTFDAMTLEAVTVR